MTGRARFIIVVAVTTVLAMFAAGTALAGGGKHGGGHASTSTSTLNLVLMDGATEAQHYGRITFDVSTTATNLPFVGLRCWQGTNWVADGYVGYFPTYMFDQWFVLDSDYWVDGVAATCTARLFYYDRRGREKVLKTLDFPVAP